MNNFRLLIAHSCSALPLENMNRCFSIMHVCSVRKILLDWIEENVSKELITASTRSSIVRGASLCCNDWMAAKKPRSKAFMSGKFGGWKINRISKPSSLAILTKSLSFSLTWHFALPCWMKIGSYISSLGHFSFMLGITFSSRNLLLLDWLN